MTPHSTIGLSPAELMFGRRLRCRFGLLWPFENVSTRVFQRQEAQRYHHTRRPQSVNFPEAAPIMVRDYSTRSSKWTPGNVDNQIGPLSYECTLQRVGVVRRHQDQILQRSERWLSSAMDDQSAKSVPVHEEKQPLLKLLKKLWDRPKGSPSSRSTGNLSHCCHETREYRAMRNGLCTPHCRTAQNEQVVAN